VRRPVTMYRSVKQEWFPAKGRAELQVQVTAREGTSPESMDEGSRG